MRMGHLKPLSFFAACLLMLFPLAHRHRQRRPDTAAPGHHRHHPAARRADGHAQSRLAGRITQGDKLQVSHSANGKMFPSGRLVVTRVNGTNAEARVTEQSGVVGPEDIVTLDTSVPVPVPKPTPKPSEPARETTRETTRKTPKEPAQSEPTRKAPKTSVQTPPKELLPSEPTREVAAALPLLPQFSARRLEEPVSPSTLPTTPPKRSIPLCIAPAHIDSRRAGKPDGTDATERPRPA